MKILLDQGTPAPVKRILAGHIVETAYQRGWSTYPNGELLRAAEAAAFDLLITTDQNLGNQQDLSGRTLAILVLPTTRWPQINNRAADVVNAVNSMRTGEYRELHWETGS